MPLSVLHIIFVGILGLIIGSFLNVVIHRVPKGESIVFPGSHCPICTHRLSARELIPIISYFMLGRRCAVCKTHISWRYPAVELLTGIVFSVTYAFRGNGALTSLVFDLIFVSLLLALTFIDIDTFRLPDVLVVLVAVLGFVNALVTENPAVWLSLGGALGAGSVFFLIAYFYPQGMGLGDVKFVAALGLYLGAPAIFFVIFLASLLGIIIGGMRVILLKKSIKDPIPFGPYLAAGAFIMLISSNLFFNFLGL